MLIYYDIYGIHCKEMQRKDTWSMKERQQKQDVTIEIMF